MSNIITEKDLSNEGYEFIINKPIELFCGLTADEINIDFLEKSKLGETQTLSDALSKINEYIKWLQTSKPLSNKVGKKNPVKIISAHIGLDESHIQVSNFEILNDKKRCFIVGTYSNEIEDIFFV